MKIKPLRSIAKSLTDMAASSRMRSSFDAILTNKIQTLTIDILEGSSNHKQAELPIIMNLHNWFIEQLKDKDISNSDLESAILQIDIDYHSIATDLNKVALFHLENQVVIITKGKLVEARSYNKIWHTRGPG